jgi:ribosome modulation factor
MTRPAKTTPFRLSRIYAQGWNAARTANGAAANPYTAEPERSRWQAGYSQALTDPRAMRAR